MAGKMVGAEFGNPNWNRFNKPRPAVKRPRQPSSGLFVRPDEGGRATETYP